MTQNNHLSSGKIRVLIAHDVRVIRESVASLLLQYPEFTVIELPSQGTGYREQKEYSAVNVVLAVAGLSDNNASDHIQGIKEAFPNAKVVIIGVCETVNENLEYIEAGASGYVLPGSSLEQLIQIIRTVHRGEASCPPDVLALLFERIASLRSQLQMMQNIELGSLTQRELEVLQLVADGLSNKEIAVLLSIEIQTVKNHVHNILEKLRVNNRREAVVCTQKLALIGEK